MSWGNFKSIVLSRRRRSLPDGVALSCPGCQKTLFRKELADNLFVCPHCDWHHTMPGPGRIKMLLDEGSGEELFAGLLSGDPLEFKGFKSYRDRLARARQDTGLEEAALCYAGTLSGHRVLLGCTDSRFLMGSMGSVVGEKLTRLFLEGARTRIPVVVVSGSGGGARMDEGVFSLLQMVKTCSAVSELHRAGGLFISVLTNPTMGGIMASYASLGDIILAEPKALIGFTGPRVIKQTTQEELPDHFQESEFLLEHGHIDRIVRRADTKALLASFIEYCDRDDGAKGKAAKKPAKKEEKA